LAGNRLATPLFDTALFMADIEQAYEEIQRRYLDGGEPKKFASRLERRDQRQSLQGKCR